MSLRSTNGRKRSADWATIGQAASSWGTEWTRRFSARPGIEDADAVVVSTDGDNTNLVIGQVAQKRFGIDCVVVRVLDPARADFYASRGLRTVCPTSNAIYTLTEAVRSCEVRPRQVVGT